MRRASIFFALSIVFLVAGTNASRAGEVVPDGAKTGVALGAAPGSGLEKEPQVPRFSVDYLDRAIKPGDDFYHFANGTWLKKNPVPADKAKWGSFSELNERNHYLIHSILEEARSASTDPQASQKREVGDFFASAMDTQLLEQLQFAPIKKELARIDQIKSTDDLFNVLADFHKNGIGGIFNSDVDPDAKNSSIYAFQLYQGGLSLPDRDYYLTDAFASQKAAYLET